MQASCLFTEGSTPRPEVVKEEGNNLGMTPNDITCNSGQKYAEYTIRLPLSRKVNYMCTFENLGGSGKAVSPVTVLKSHSEYTFRQSHY